MDPSIQSSTRHASGVNLEVLLNGVKAYVSGCIAQYERVESSANCATANSTTGLSQSFWHEVKHGIYFKKVGSDLAAPALERAAELAQAAVAKGLQFDLSFLQELFLTLSPANVRIQPCIRQNLLRVFNEELKNVSNANHPLAIICRELQQDNDTGYVSETAVDYMLKCIDSYKSSYGRIAELWERAFKIECAAVALLRRDGQLQRAADKASALLEREEAKYVQLDTQSRSLETLRPIRLAATELSHVRIDQADVNLLDAAELSLLVLTGTQWDSSKSPCWPPSAAVLDQSLLIKDGKSLHALECIGKICEIEHDYKHGIEWLVLAKNLAIELSSAGRDQFTIEHIEEKIARFQATMK